MEFSCRLGTESGEVIEEVHVAESESRLRQELEAKGLYILSLSRRGAFGWPGLALRKRRRLKTREFLVFNQELAALLRAGLPLVQSLDILRQRVEDPGLQGDHRRCTRPGARGRVALRGVRGAGGDDPGDVHRLAARGGEERRTRRGDSSVRIDYVKVIAAVKRKTVSAMVYPAILLSHVVRRGGDHRAVRRATV